MQAYIREPKNKADATVIWLHGLGANGMDFYDVPERLNLDSKSIRFIFPNAPSINVTVNGGMYMPAWYDIYSLQMQDVEDEAGIKQSQKIVESYIAEQIEQGILSSRIIIVGFSQGGALALYAGLHCRQKLAGIIMLSAYMLLANKFNAKEFCVNHNTPIFMGHGIFDPVVPVNLGQKACEMLQANNYQVEWNSYAIQHTVDNNELLAIGNFINRVLVKNNIKVSTHQGVRVIPIDEIYYFEADQKYTIIHHQDGQVLTDDSLNNLENKFPNELIRIHRKFLVIKKQITSIERSIEGDLFISLKNSKNKLPVSRRKQSLVRKLLCQ